MRYFPENLDALCEIAILLGVTFRKKYDKAVDFLEKVLEIDKNFTRAKVYLTLIKCFLRKISKEEG